MICLLAVEFSCLNACGENGEQPKETTGGQPGSESIAGTEEVLYSAPYLPDADYGGYIFRTVSVEDYKW